MPGISTVFAVSKNGWTSKKGLLFTLICNAPDLGIDLLFIWIYTKKAKSTEKVLASKPHHYSILFVRDISIWFEIIRKQIL